MPAPKGNNNNPTGKGGFQERPEQIAKGRWSGETSISYNMNKLIRCSVDEFKTWIEKHPDTERTMAQEIAYQAVLNARKDLSYLKEVNDRTEGKPQQTNILIGDEENPVQIEVTSMIAKVYGNDSTGEVHTDS